MNKRNYHDIITQDYQPTERYRDFEGFTSSNDALRACLNPNSPIPTYVWDLLAIEDEDLKTKVRDITINLVYEMLDQDEDVTWHTVCAITHTVHEMLTVRWWMKTDVR